MSHTAAHRRKLLGRVRRIAGQVAAVERQLQEEADCATTLQLVASVRGAVVGLMDELIEEHLREHVAKPGLSDVERSKAAQQLLTLIKRYGQ